MNLLTLTPLRKAELTTWLTDDTWLVACLCARWCDLCESYRENFAALAARHPDKHFVWIDIEDHAELVGDMEVENFPTLLLQRAEIVAFFGPVLPDLRVADRIISAQAQKSLADLQAEVLLSPEKRAWQVENNLRLLQI